MTKSLDRFFKKVEIVGDCWFWTGSKNTGGYGSFTEGRKNRYVAHRWLYEQFINEVPKGLDLDHLCRNRCCVNPLHLEPVTRSVNSRRGIGPKLAANRQLIKTVCPKGHPYDSINTRYEKTGSRRCRTCHKIAEQKRRALNK